jgi:hypothetical protein
VTEDLDPPRSGEFQRMDWRHVHVLDGFREQPAEHSDRMHPKCQTARKWTKADRRYE